ncbi:MULTISPECIES: hypothetical protein [Saccharibacillus]|uniref:hypothetical protein n=1 Tax=Saccharibacillus TaxID=456492 RepID=UPI00123BDAD5|nr:hypothetical protein [Saccharibacillus sp. WB 17]MWJ30557.1 hypothetical protein [Saccharibacillus sp. WB 17]
MNKRILYVAASALVSFSFFAFLDSHSSDKPHTETENKNERKVKNGIEISATPSLEAPLIIPIPRADPDEPFEKIRGVAF